MTIDPDVTDMLWTAARKEAMERLHEDLRKDKDKHLKCVKMYHSELPMSGIYDINII